MKELRTLLPKEQELVRKLAELKGDGENINLQKYQAGSVLEQIVGFNFAGIKWDVGKQDPIYIFYEKHEERDEALSSYFALCDFLYLLEDLEHTGLIAIQSASFDEDRLLYNRKKYTKEEFENWQFKSEPMGLSYLDNKREILTCRIDIVDYLEQYIHLKIIYPRPALFEYVADGFKTTEQKRHDEQMNTLHDELDNTRRTLHISMFTLLLSIVTLLSTVFLDTRKTPKPIKIVTPLAITEPVKIAESMDVHQREKQIIALDSISFMIEYDTINKSIYFKTK